MSKLPPGYFDFGEYVLVHKDYLARLQALAQPASTHAVDPHAPDPGTPTPRESSSSSSSESES